MGFWRGRGEGMCEKQDVLSILRDRARLCGSRGACCVFRANFAQERLTVSHEMKTHMARFPANQGGITTRAGQKKCDQSSFCSVI